MGSGFRPQCIRWAPSHGRLHHRSLLHTDLRAGNMLLRPDGMVIVVDWSWPCVSAFWVDLVS
ncbi:phosphotransferase [Nocardia sp. NPDC050193]